MLSWIGGLMLAQLAATAQETWTFGQLQLSPCELTQPRSAATTRAWCAILDVAENPDLPQGRRIALRVAIVRSNAADPEPDPVVFLAGGPGQAASESYPAIAQAMEPLRRRRHIVLLDQRGTGGSNPLSCSDEGTATDLRDNGTPSPQRAAAAVRDCLQRVQAKADPRYYTTTDAVRDLEALRMALQVPTVNLIGVSYGTRVAQQYARRHPAVLRSLVLDGVVPNSLVLGAEFAKNLDAVLRSRSAACVADYECKKHFGDMYKTLYDTRERLRADPQTVTIRDPLSWELREQQLDAEGFGGLVRLYAYSSETAALLPLGISETARGNPAPLLGQLKLITADFEATMTSGMGLSVICSEDVDRLGDGDPAESALILGGELIATLRAQCEQWPHGARPDDFSEPLHSDVPSLLLSGEFDPVTPARYGDAVAKALPRARHLVAPGQGHNVIGRGCIPELLKRFVEKRQTEELDAGCIARMGATPFFLDYNGAAP